MRFLKSKTIIESTVVGLGIAVAAVITTVFVGTLSSNDEFYSIPLELSSSTLMSAFLGGVLLAPLLETLFFSVLGNALLERNRSVLTVLFVAIMAVLGWFLHGADASGWSRAIGFLALAVWFWRVYRSGGAFDAFMATALAHASWNLTLVLVWIARAYS